MVLAVLLLFVNNTAAGEPDQLAAKIGSLQDAIGQRNARWTAGETPLSDLTPEQMAGYLGALDPPAAQFDARPRTNALMDLSLPAAFDWRSKDGGNYVTAVKNQSGCGSCWAFAATAALEAKVLITLNQPGDSFDLSEQTMVSCSGAGSCGGGYLTTAADYLQSTGLPVESCYPYFSSNGVCTDTCPDWQQSAYRVLSAAVVPQTVADLKSALVQYGPIAVGMTVYSDFQSYSGGVYTRVSGGYLGGHAVVIVGYDDAASCFIVKNSWGDGWGEAGFFRIAYQEVTGATDFGRTALAYGEALPPFNPAALGEAVDNTALTWKSGLAGIWFRQSAVTTYDNDAAQSGAIYEYEPSWIETSVVGPADISFDERLSNNAYGYLTLYLDGEDIHTLSYRDSGWQHLVKTLGPGLHQLRWALRSSSYYGTDTAWLDHVVLGPASEEVSRPAIPSGPATGVRVGSMQSYEAGGSVSSLGHGVEYRFDWGDGARSSWSSRTNAGHVWHITGTYAVKAQARCATHGSLRTEWSDSLVVVVDPPLPVTLAEALDAPTMTFETGGDATWFAQDATTYFGGDAVQAGHLTGGNGSDDSWISTTVTGPGAVQFFWSISSSVLSYLQVCVDGCGYYSYYARISGVVPWQPQLVAFGPGAHTVTWRYLPASLDASRMNTAWIDRIEFLPTYETIPTPGAPTGPTNLTVGKSYLYNVAAVASNQAHPLEYRFDWGDGTTSDWTDSLMAAHVWSAPMGCSVKVQTRCAAHPELVTTWSAGLAVAVYPLVSIATPTVPSGNSAWWVMNYTSYTTEGGDPTHPSNRQYRFDWGDGTISTWSGPTTGDKLVADHRWTAAGDYTVKAQSRSSVQTDLESAWSEGLAINVATLPVVGLATALDNASLVWTTGGDAGWFGQSFDTVAGGTAAQSGSIADGQNSWIQTTVTGPARVSFYWRIAAENASLTFTIDGINSGYSNRVISGEQPWAFRVVLIGSGQHTLKWVFQKGISGFKVPDCARLDQVTVAATSESFTSAISIGGSTSGISGTVLPFTVSGASTSLGHAVEYRFDWNDGTLSDWFATGDATHAWPVPGYYTIRAQARCAAHPDVVTEWSAGRDVIISTPSPAAPEGPSEGFDSTSYTFTTAGVVPDPGVPVYYMFDWGDGGFDNWSSTLSKTHYWAQPGTYQVRVKTLLHSGGLPCVSPWSSPLSVTIQWFETISVPTLDGPSSGINSTPLVYTASGAVSSLGHPLNYLFEWDSVSNGFVPQAMQEHSWYYAGAHTVKVTAFCATHSRYKAVSAPLTTTTVLPQETVTVPNAPVGPAAVRTGKYACYEFSGSTTSLGHAVKYEYDTGDGRILTVSQNGKCVSWSTPGTYALSARAHCSLDYANQSDWSPPLTVVVADPPEIITAPAVPTGTSSGLYEGDTAVYTSGGAVSNLGHEVEYRFLFGDTTFGKYTEWSSVPLMVHTWKKWDSSQIRAQARCVAHPTEVSAWSATLNVYVSQETIARLGTPSGPSSGLAGSTYEFTATDADPHLLHGREFRFDWGDGTLSGWQPSVSRNHAWPATGTYPVRVKGRCAVHTEVEASSWSVALDVVIRPANDLGAAVDAPGLAWETGGDAAWFNQGEVFHSDNDAARSGASGANQFSWMRTAVPGPGQVSFFWRVSSGPGAALVLYLDGVEQLRLSGDLPWEQRIVPLSSGTHTLLWLYRKDGTAAAGADCGWVDQMVLTTETDLVSTPAAPSGPVSGIAAQTYGYEAAGALSSKGHALEYRFDWGDGTVSTWSSAADADHAWSAAGTYPVVVQARCQAEPAATSAFSEQHQVTVTPVPCSYSVAPTSLSLPASADLGSIAVTTQTGCAWTASESLSWVTITAGTSGSGNGEVYISATANTGANPRTGNIVVAGTTVAINQAAKPLTASFVGTVSGAVYENPFGPAPLTVTFDANGSAGPNPITSFHWDFGDGQTADSASPSDDAVTHEYTLTGSYIVTLAVSDGSQTDTTQRLVTVAEQVHYVTTPAQLQAALSAAQTNGKHDLIRIAAGTYHLSDNDNTHFTYLGAAGENKDLVLEGGWTPDFTQRAYNLPTNLENDYGSDQTQGGILSLDGASNNTTGSLAVDGVTFSSGRCGSGGGGGVYAATAGTINFSNCEFADNRATGGDGGGFYLSSRGGSVWLTGNKVRNNTATIGGAGLVKGAAVYASGNEISGNTGTLVGGLPVFVDPGGELVFSNNTIFGNSTTSGGAGLSVELNEVIVVPPVFDALSDALPAPAAIDLHNNLIYGNTGSAVDLSLFTDCAYLASNVDLNLVNNDLGAVGLCADYPIDPTNVSIEPWFIANASPDIRLRTDDTALIDAGTNLLIPSSDFEGDATPLDGGSGSAIADIGADEYNPANPGGPTVINIAPGAPAIGTVGGNTTLTATLDQPAKRDLVLYLTHADTNTDSPGQPLVTVTPAYLKILKGATSADATGQALSAARHGTSTITATDPSGLMTSGSVTVTVDINQPTVLTLGTPSGPIATATPTYTWNAQLGVDSYQLWVGNGTIAPVNQWYTAAAAGCGSGSGACSVTPAATLSPGAWSFNVKGRNAAGTGPWAYAKAFTLVSIPTVLTLGMPSGPIGTATPTYTWNARPGVDSYLLWVGNGTIRPVYQWYTAAAAGCGSGTGTCSVTPAATLSPGAWSFNVRGRNTAGVGPWAYAKAFTFSIPPSLTLGTPSGPIGTATPTYRWSAQAGVESYLLWVGNGTIRPVYQWYTAAAAGCGSGTGTCSVTPAATLAPGAWSFNVKGRNAAGTGPWAYAKAFTLVSTPTVLTLGTPSGPIGTATPTYTWSAQSGVDSYLLWVGNGTIRPVYQWYTAAAAGCGSGTGTCSVTPAATLAPGAWSFNVKGRNAAGTGPWAYAKAFTYSP